VKKTKVINFFGGPGVGKSGFAAELFGYMKSKDMSVELAREVAKDLVWDKSPKINDQIYILGRQHDLIYSLMGEVDYIITDCPLLMLSAYVWNPANLAKIGCSKQDLMFLKFDFEQLTGALHHVYPSINFLIERSSEFTDEGRIHDLEQSIKLDREIEERVQENGPFTRVKTFEDVKKALDF